MSEKQKVFSKRQFLGHEHPANKRSQTASDSMTTNFQIASHYNSSVLKSITKCKKTNTTQEPGRICSCQLKTGKCSHRGHRIITNGQIIIEKRCLVWSEQHTDDRVKIWHKQA